MTKSFGNFPGPIGDIIKQLDNDALENLASNIDMKQIQELLAAAYSMAEQNMGPEEREALKVLMQIFMGKS